MLDYDLANLIAWTRNACGDRQKATREELVGTGGPRLALANSGGVTLGTVTVDGDAVSPGDVSVEDGDLVFAAGSEPPIDADVVAAYGLTRYTDDDLKSFLVDAALGVSADLPVRYAVQPGTGHVQADDALAEPGGTDLDVTLQQLIVYKAALDVFADKANQAADDAIMIRDGDTTIDTSKTSTNSEAAMKRLTERYRTALLRAKHGRLKGVGTTD